jgi:hypothetical protein
MIAAPVALERGLSVRGQLPVEAEPRREARPGEVVDPGKGVPRGVSDLVELVLLFGERLVPVVAKSEVQRQAVVQPEGVVGEDADP